MSHGPEPESESPASGEDRRRFLTNASRAAMAAGLVGGYGGLAAMAGKFLYPPAADEGLWQFVTEGESLEQGDSLRYQAPTGETINVARQGNSGSVEDFIALSSTCPHLGCQVRWEEDQQRFFCPCHNGIFDPSGKATAGPPGEAGQSLPRYPLKLESGLLFIEVPPPRFAGQKGRVLPEDTGPCGPGHDPCLSAGRARGASETESA